ncbi:hypothetical protein [Cupriavidus nantongensis]|uniref:Uncharacterized protein n=1 Tax=Cupriavidus nantongensis TaxID=1796606 RepID=A0A142JIN4_9BURK|nr:hypothetical protein [Cupriavidus nantongensis]AMR77946.1 hypothetical protein A2G96_09445 [Cupriavidus nantongensis]
MYGLYSTVVDKAHTDIAQTGGIEPSEKQVRELTFQQSDDAVFSGAVEELIQCEVLHYGDVAPSTAWISMAKRVGRFGKITGPHEGEQYSGDVAEEAQEMNLHFMTSAMPSKQLQGKAKKLPALAMRLISGRLARTFGRQEKQEARERAAPVPDCDFHTKQ